MDPKELHIDAALTTFSIKYGQGTYIAEKVYPRVGVTKLSDKIKVYGSQHLKRIETVLHDKAEAALFQWGFETDDSYLLQGYGLRDFVSRADLENADKPIDPMKDTVEAILDVLMLDQEYRVATSVCTAGSYGASNKTTLTGTAQWSDYTSGISDPIANIRTAKAAVRASCGKAPNSIILDWKVGETLARHPNILDLIRYTDPTLLTNGGLPPRIQGLNVIEAGAIKDTAKRGQTMSLDTIWGTYCAIAYINPRPTKKSITLGVTFQKGTRKVLKIWDDKLGVSGAWYIKVVLPEMDEKMITANCGYLITGAIA